MRKHGQHQNLEFGHGGNKLYCDLLLRLTLKCYTQCQRFDIKL